MGCLGWTATVRAVAPVLAVACLELVLGRAALAGAPSCPGDCAGDGEVTIEDLITGVNIALGSQPLSACFAMDASGDGAVTVDELIRAVAAALNGCPAAPTATLPATATASVTPSRTTTQTATATAPDTATATSSPTPPPTTPPATATATPIPTMPVHFCDLPGSMQSNVPGQSVVPGGAPSAPDLSWLHLPLGFCAHFFAKVGNTRQLRFAPGGELFVASPTKFTTSNGGGSSSGGPGRAAIVVLPDDDRDGTADQTLTFLGNLPATVGLLFTNGYLYYQNETKILRMPYAPGDRTPSGASEQVADITLYTSLLHWPKTLDAADNGTIYVGNGGDEGERCNPDTRPFHGGILKIDGSPGAAPVAKGFRNAISVRCVRGKNLCFAIELARDFSTGQGGREKLVPIRDGDDWGFPCCATKDQPYTDLNPVPDCSGVSAEIDSFLIGHTPFDLDYDTGKWPAPWDNRAYVALHGTYGNWDGARVVGIGLDAMTGQVLPGSDLAGMSSGAMVDFATGWGIAHQSRGRPTAVAFAPDGRLFLGNDTSGDIIWIAPMSLTTQPAAPQR